MGNENSGLYPDNVTFYNFTSIFPEKGQCFTQQFGMDRPIKDYPAFICAILMTCQGLFGLWKSRDVSVGSRYMFSLIFGYGAANIGHTITLWNGFKKTSSALLNLMQAVIIIRLISTWKFPPFDKTTGFHFLSSLLMSTFGIYPIISVVLESSFENRWVGWLTFDLIWAPILIICIVIFVFRKRYPQYQQDHEIFRVMFSGAFACAVAYIFLQFDEEMCNKAIAYGNFYGIWLFFMGLTFYYLATLDAWLQSSWQGYRAVVTRWPKKYIVLYIHMRWEKEDPHHHGESLDYT